MKANDWLGIEAEWRHALADPNLARCAEGDLSSESAGAAYRAAVALGRSRLFGVALGEWDGVLIVPLARAAARRLTQHLRELRERSDALPEHWDEAEHDIEAREECLSLLEGRMDAWAAFVALDEAQVDAIARSLPGQAELTTACSRSQLELAPADEALLRQKEILSVAAGTELLANWRRLLVEPYRLFMPWWLDGTLEDLVEQGWKGLLTELPMKEENVQDSLQAVSTSGTGPVGSQRKPAEIVRPMTEARARQTPQTEKSQALPKQLDTHVSAVPRGESMTVVSYNLCQGGMGNPWLRVIEAFDPDLFFAQESLAPHKYLEGTTYDGSCLRAVWHAVPTVSWGSAVYVKCGRLLPIQPPLPPGDFQGSLVGAEVAGFSHPGPSGRRLRVFSLHAPRLQGSSYQRAVNALLDLIVPYGEDADIVIAGDFNLTISERQSDEVRSPTELQNAAADQAIRARLRDDFGLLNCWQTANPGLPLGQTLRASNNSAFPHHIDGIFVPASWRSSLLRCRVEAGPAWACSSQANPVSDHNPIVAEFTKTVGSIKAPR